MIMWLGIEITDMMSWTGVAQLQLVLRACSMAWGTMSSADAPPVPVSVVGLLQAPGEPAIFTVINTCRKTILEGI